MEPVNPQNCYSNIKDNPRHCSKAYETLYIQQKVYDLGVYLWPALAKINREQRFILVQTTMQDFNRIRELIVIANKKYTKKKYSARVGYSGGCI